MSRSRRSFRIAVASPLTAALLVLGVAVPAMERAELAHVPVAESEHAPGSCPAPHDHTICTQVGASHALPVARIVARSTRPLAHFGLLQEAERWSVLSPRATVSARAPPGI